MLKSLSRGLVLAAGLLASSAIADPDPMPVESISRKDPRWILIKQFFLEKNAPAHEFVEDFLIASDRNGLDWRLLPSIALIESGGGKQARNNNIFGWANCKVHFKTTRDGIYRVASRLRHSELYKHKKTVDQILWTYNPQEAYVRHVRAAMDRLGPAHLIPAPAY